MAGLQSTPFQAQPAGKSERERERLEKDSETPRGDVCWPASTWLYWEHLQISWVSLSHALPSNSVSVSDSFRGLMYFPFLGNNSLSRAQSQTAATVSEAFLVLVSQLSFCLTRNTVSSPLHLSLPLCLSFCLSFYAWLLSLQFIVLWIWIEIDVANKMHKWNLNLYVKKQNLN